MTQRNPEPLDEQPPVEVRGGSRPEDYMPTLREQIEEDAGLPFGTEDEPLGGNDPDAQ